MECFFAARENEIEAIKLKELVRYLIDLSEANSDSVLAQASLFDPYVFCMQWAEDLSKDSEGMLKAKIETPHASYPALYGNTRQLARMLTILVQLLQDVYQITLLDVSILVSLDGCEFRLSSFFFAFW